jgi:hypothetical protein
LQTEKPCGPLSSLLLITLSALPVPHNTCADTSAAAVIVERCEQQLRALADENAMRKLYFDTMWLDYKGRHRAAPASLCLSNNNRASFLLNLILLAWPRTGLMMRPASKAPPAASASASPEELADVPLPPLPELNSATFAAAVGPSSSAPAATSSSASSSASGPTPQPAARTLAAPFSRTSAHKSGRSMIAAPPFQPATAASQLTATGSAVDGSVHGPSGTANGAASGLLSPASTSSLEGLMLNSTSATSQLAAGASATPQVIATTSKAPATGAGFSAKLARPTAQQQKTAEESFNRNLNPHPPAPPLLPRSYLPTGRLVRARRFSGLPSVDVAEFRFTFGTVFPAAGLLPEVRHAAAAASTSGPAVLVLID